MDFKVKQAKLEMYNRKLLIGASQVLKTIRNIRWTVPEFNTKSTFRSSKVFSFNVFYDNNNMQL
jgi:hypothetical protein